MTEFRAQRGYSSCRREKIKSVTNIAGSTAVSVVWWQVSCSDDYCVTPPPSMPRKLQTPLSPSIGHSCGVGSHVTHDLSAPSSGNKIAPTLSKVSARGDTEGPQISRKISIDFVTLAISKVSNLQVGRHWSVYSQPDSPKLSNEKRPASHRRNFLHIPRQALTNFALCLRRCSCGQGNFQRSRTLFP